MKTAKEARGQQLLTLGTSRGEVLMELFDSGDWLRIEMTGITTWRKGAA